MLVDAGGQRDLVEGSLTSVASLACVVDVTVAAGMVIVGEGHISTTASMSASKTIVWEKSSALKIVQSWVVMGCVDWA